MSHQGKSTQNTALILNVSKIPYRKNEWWKNDWNHFPVWPLGFMGIMAPPLWGGAMTNQMSSILNNNLRRSWEFLLIWWLVYIVSLYKMFCLFLALPWHWVALMTWFSLVPRGTCYVVKVKLTSTTSQREIIPTFWPVTHCSRMRRDWNVFNCVENDARMDRARRLCHDSDLSDT